MFVRPRLYGEKLSRVEGSTAYPSYPGRANFSYISLQNLANRLHEKQKVGSAGRVTRLAGSPFCDGRVTLLAGPTFLHINTLARLAGSTPSRRDNQSMRELCCHWERKMAARPKSSSSGSVKKWSWSPTMVESIIDSLKEYKSLCEFNATDFNADKVKLYEKVRQMMAGKYASENYFGPVF